MPEETMDANQAVDSSSTAQPEATQTTSPADAQSVSKEQTGNETNPNVPFHEHPRFKELISERNQYKQELAELHSKLAKPDVPEVNTLAEVEQDLIKEGVNPAVARKLALSMDKVSGARIAPIEKATLEQQVNSTAQKFADSHPDFENVRKDMFELYASLPPQLAEAIGNDTTGKGLQFLYNSVKEANVKGMEKAAYEKGMQDGYKQKNLKSSVSPTGGHTAPQNNQPITDDDISKMSMEDYKKNKASILKSLGTRVP